MMGYLAYFIFALLSISVSLVPLFLKRKGKIIDNFALLFILLFFYILAIFKGPGVGIDTISYRKMYLEDTLNAGSLNNYLAKNSPEFLFYFLVYFFSIILHFDVRLFFAFCYLIIVLFLFLYFFNKKQSSLKLTFFFFFGFFVMSFSGLRQSISISIFMIALKLLKHFKYKHRYIGYYLYYLLILICFFFHASSILLIFVPFIFRIRINEDWSFAPFSFLVFGRLIGSSLLLFFSNLMYVPYKPAPARLSVSFLICIVLFIAIYFVLLNKKTSSIINKKINIFESMCFDDEKRNHFWLFFLYTAFLVLNTVTPSLCRLSMFFYIGITAFTFDALEKIKNEKLCKITTVMIALFLGVFFVVSTPNLGLVPYVFG